MFSFLIFALLAPLITALGDAIRYRHGASFSPVQKRDNNDNCTSPAPGQFTPEQLYNMTINFFDNFM